MFYLLVHKLEKAQIDLINIVLDLKWYVHQKQIIELLSIAYEYKIFGVQWDRLFSGRNEYWFNSLENIVSKQNKTIFTSLPILSPLRLFCFYRWLLLMFLQLGKIPLVVAFTFYLTGGHSLQQHAKFVIYKNFRYSTLWLQNVYLIAGFNIIINSDILKRIHSNHYSQII